jgi:hypothetical protein
MNGLTAALSPSSLPVNISTSDIQLAQLTLTLTNSSGSGIDLSNGQIRIDFVVDPGNGGSGGALLLSDSSGSSTTNPSPVQTVDVTAAAAGGTSWTPQSTFLQPGLCTFMLVPPTGTGQGMLAAGESIAFNFNGIAVDLTEGTSQVTVTVLVSGTATQLTPAPTVTKTPPAVTITSFTADNQNLDPTTGNEVVLSWSTIGAAACSLDWNQTATTVVRYNGQSMTGPWLATASVPPPLQTTPNAPVTAVVFQDTQFNLTAEGAGAQLPPSHLPILISSVVLSGPPTVAPCVQFPLSWQGYNGMGITLDWTASDGGTVTVTSGGNNVNQGDQLAVTGTVLAAITRATTFVLNVTAEEAQFQNPLLIVPLQSPVAILPQPQFVVSVYEVTLSSFTVASIQVIDAATGQQAVTLTWVASNATGFTVTGYDGTSTDTGDPVVSGNVVSGPFSYPYNQLTTDPALELPLAYGSVIYTIIAEGYNPAGLPQAQLQVYPLGVALSNFTASNQQVVGPGQQQVTLTWEVQNATSLTIATLYAGTETFVTLTDASTTTRQMLLPYLATETVTYVIDAQGYPPPGDWTNSVEAQVTITPLPVTQLSVSASQTRVLPGGTVTLTWGAVAATGFTLTSDRPGFPATSFPPAVMTYVATLYITTTFTITALGYGPNPTASVTITVPKLKEKEKEKDHKEALEPALPRLSARPDGESDAGLPAGTQQAFIDPGERPDVGAHLRGGDSGA